jgi:hypothetical protein
VPLVTRVITMSRNETSRVTRWHVQALLISMITQDTFSCIIYRSFISHGPSPNSRRIASCALTVALSCIAPYLLLFSSRSRVSNTSELSAGVRPLPNGLFSVLSPTSSAFTQRQLRVRSVASNLLSNSTQEPDSRTEGTPYLGLW